MRLLSIGFLVCISWVTVLQPSPGTMMVFDLDGDGLEMTSQDRGVRFDLDGDGKAEQVAWTAPGSDDSILCLDANGNRVVDNGKEVIGRQFRLREPWSASSGAEALIYELQAMVKGQQPVPKGASQIDTNDPIFRRLVLWTDRNHDGASTSSELASLDAYHVTRIFTGFQRPNPGTARSVDNFGNKRLFEGSFQILARGMEFRRTLVEFEPRR